MIKIKKIENEIYYSNMLAYDVGEIVKIEAKPSMDSGNMEYYDSQGLKFVSTAKIGRARNRGFCSIFVLAERKDVFPEEYREEIFANKNHEGESVPCNDPRVLWADIVSYWALANGKCNRGNLSFFLTEFLPYYREAATWLEKNRFPVFATHDYSDELHDPYYREYYVLDVPPEIDWAEGPVRK